MHPPKILAFLLKTKAVLFLLFLVIAVFFALSQNFYIPMETVHQNSFSSENPQNVVSYELIHVGPYHLVSNAIALLFFGIALELALSSMDAFAIFFGSAILTAIFFVIINPGASVVGASAGILSLATGSFFASPKKSVIAFALAIIFSVILLFLLSSALSAAQDDFFQKETSIKSGIETAIAEKNFEKQKSLEQELEIIATEKTAFEESQAGEKSAVSDYASHVFAALFGVCYVFFFRRKKFFESMGQIDCFLHNLRQKLKKR